MGETRFSRPGGDQERDTINWCDDQDTIFSTKDNPGATAAERRLTQLHSSNSNTNVSDPHVDAAIPVKVDESELFSAFNDHTFTAFQESSDTTKSQNYFSQSHSNDQSYSNGSQSHANGSNMESGQSEFYLTNNGYFRTADEARSSSSSLLAASTNLLKGVGTGVLQAGSEVGNMLTKSKRDSMQSRGSGVLETAANVTGALII